MAPGTEQSWNYSENFGCLGSSCGSWPREIGENDSIYIIRNIDELGLPFENM